MPDGWTVSSITHNGVKYMVATDGRAFRIRAPNIVAIEVRLIEDSLYDGELPRSQIDSDEFVVIPIERLIRED